MLADWLVSTDLKGVDHAELALTKTQQNVKAQKWLLRQQTNHFFARNDTLACVFLLGCLKGLSRKNKGSSSTSLLSFAMTTLKLVVPFAAKI